MSALQYQSISSEGHIPTNQEMGPTIGPLDHYPLEEEFLQFISFDTDYSGNWLANQQNVQPNGQIHQTSFDDSLNNHSNREPAGQSTEAGVDPSSIISTQMQSDWRYPGAFGDQGYNIPTHMQLAGQPTLNALNRSSNTYTNIEDLGQSAANLTNQSSYSPTNTHPLEQHTQAPINYGDNTVANVPLDGQATQPTLHYSGNPQTNAPLDGQATPTPVPSSSNPQSDAPLNGRATPAPGPSSGKGNKKTRTPGKSSPVSTKGKVKHPAVVEDKDIEKCARNYDISYDETRILLDYANARLKGIETSEPRDAPSRYIISRFEQVRRTYPDHATWPYDLPKEKIIRLLPGQKKQDRAPHNSYQGACEKRRQELDDRYNESRQWEGPPPPKPDETQQDTLIDPAIDSIATESTPLPNFDSTELANEVIALGSPSSWGFDTLGQTQLFHQIMQDGIQSLDNAASAPTSGSGMEALEGSVQLPPQPPFTAPIQPADLYSMNYLANGPAAPKDIHMAGSGESAQFPSLLPTFTPMEQDSGDLLENSNPPAIFDITQCKNPLAPLTFAPMEQDSLDPLDNSNPSEVSEEWEFNSMFDEEEQRPSPAISTPAEQDNLTPSANVDPPAIFDVNQCNNPLAPLTFAPMEQNSVGPLDNAHPPAGSDDDDFNSLFDGSEGCPSPPPTPPPTEQDNTNPLTNAKPAAESVDSPLGSLFEEPVELINNHEMVQQPEDSAQYPAPLPTFTPMEQDGMIPLDNLYLPAVTNDGQLDSILDEEPRFMSDSEFERWMQSLEGGIGEIGMEGLAMEM